MVQDFLPSTTPPLARLSTIFIFHAGPIAIVQAPVYTTPAPTVAITSIKDIPVNGLKTLTVIITWKLKKPVDRVPLSKSTYQRPHWW